MSASRVLPMAKNQSRNTFNLHFTRSHWLLRPPKACPGPVGRESWRRVRRRKVLGKQVCPDRCARHLPDYKCCGCPGHTRGKSAKIIFATGALASSEALIGPKLPGCGQGQFAAPPTCCTP